MDTTELGTSAATEEKSEKPQTATGGKGGSRRGGRGGRVRGIGRLVREVWAELRKVLWPTRRELVNYTIVVLVFVTTMVLIVAGLDFLFGKAVLTVFGT